ncbi:MAG: MFS transporter [Gammaproteobacteria bacterium]|nr:MFS transporter [Gammaproteobacteria bacterium]
MSEPVGHSRRGLLLAIFVSAMPATLILPMMPSIGETLGVGGAALGLLFGIYPLTSVIAAPLWGRISDRLGRKPALLGTLAGATLAFLIFGFSGSYAGLLWARALQGLSGSARGIGFAVMGDTTDGEDRAAGMGRVSAAMALAFTLGPILGAAFMDETPGPWAQAIRAALGAPVDGFSYLLPALLGALLNAGAFLIVLVGFRETWRPGKTAAAAPSAGPAAPSALAALLNVVVIMLILQFVVAGLIQGTLQFAFTLWANDILGWSAREIALSLAALGLGFVISSGVLLRPLLHRLGAARVVLVGVVVDLAGMALFMALAERWQWAVLGLFLSSVGGGLWGTTIVGQISRETPQAHQGVMMGVINGAGLIGRVAGPPLAGFAVGALGARAPFAAIIAGLLLMLLVCLRIARLTATRAPANEPGKGPGRGPQNRTG